MLFKGKRKISLLHYLVKKRLHYLLSIGLVTENGTYLWSTDATNLTKYVKGKAKMQHLLHAPWGTEGMGREDAIYTPLRSGFL